MIHRLQLSDGTQLAVQDEGAGPPVLFLHGFPLDRSQWRFQVDGLHNRFRVLVPDLRGFGQSSLNAETVAMSRFADDLLEVLELLGIREPIALCGLSMGGYIAFQFVKKFPDRVAKLILCDTRSAADSPEARANRLAMAERVLTDGTTFVAEAMLPKVFASHTRNSRPELVESVQQTMLRTEPASIAAAQRGMASRPDVTDWLPEIRVPGLVLVGDEDVISPPAEMEAIANRLPNASFVIIPDAGHLAPLENPDAVNWALRRFLES